MSGAYCPSCDLQMAYKGSRGSRVKDLACPKCGGSLKGQYMPMRSASAEWHPIWKGSPLPNTAAPADVIINDADEERIMPLFPA